jgi:hypothetical protein
MRARLCALPQAILWISHEAKLYTGRGFNFVVNSPRPN